MKKIVLIALFSCFFFSLAFSQSRPPWIVGNPPAWHQGELPILKVKGNRFLVVTSSDVNLSVAERKAREQVLHEILTMSGITTGGHSQSITRQNTHIQATETESKEYIDLEGRLVEEVFSDGEAFGRFCLMDKHIEKKGGQYHFAGLYLIANKDMTLAPLPPLTYGMDRGAWRSLIVPGWAQFYQGRTGAGIAFLGTEVALIGTTVYFQSKVNLNRRRMNEATSIEVKEGYKQRYDKMSLYRTIAAGASVAWYAFNAIDAFTSKTGRLYYTIAYGTADLSLSPAPVIIPQTGDVGFGLAFNITF